MLIQILLSYYTCKSLIKLYFQCRCENGECKWSKSSRVCVLSSSHKKKDRKPKGPSESTAGDLGVIDFGSMINQRMRNDFINIDIQPSLEPKSPQNTINSQFQDSLNSCNPLHLEMGQIFCSNGFNSGSKCSFSCRRGYALTFKGTTTKCKCSNSTCHWSKPPQTCFKIRKNIPVSIP